MQLRSNLYLIRKSSFLKMAVIRRPWKWPHTCFSLTSWKTVQVCTMYIYCIRAMAYTCMCMWQAHLWNSIVTRTTLPLLNGKLILSLYYLIERCHLIYNMLTCLFSKVAVKYLWRMFSAFSQELLRYLPLGLTWHHLWPSATMLCIQLHQRAHCLWPFQHSIRTTGNLKRKWHKRCHAMVVLDFSN